MVQNIRSVPIGITKEFGPDEVSSVLGHGFSLAQQADDHLTVQAEAAAARIDGTVETSHLDYLHLLNAVRNQARLHDLTIPDAESEAANLDRSLIETLLMDSGRPLLIVPPGQEADLLVMDCYAHSTLRGLIFGRSQRTS
jgi:nucleotide-binding universal stress UspA family protein